MNKLIKFCKIYGLEMVIRFDGDSMIFIDFTDRESNTTTRLSINCNTVTERFTHFVFEVCAFDYAIRELKLDPSLWEAALKEEKEEINEDDVV